jgi:hypothetical protein
MRRCWAQASSPPRVLGEPRSGAENWRGVHAHAEAGLAVYDAEMHQPMASSYGDHDARTWARSFSALSLGFAGEAQAARAMARTVRSSSQGASMIRFRLGGHSTSPRQWHRFLRDVALAAQHAEASRRIATEHDPALLRAWSTGVAGWCAAEHGDADCGIASLREAVTALQAT